MIRLIDGRRMQCKDIPDDLFLEAVRLTRRPWGWAMRWDVQVALEVVLGPIPVRIVLAKARRLIQAKRMGGCPCGCRGDFELPETYTAPDRSAWVDRLLDSVQES